MKFADGEEEPHGRTVAADIVRRVTAEVATSPVPDAPVRPETAGSGPAPGSSRLATA